MREPDYQRDGVTLYCGDCLDILPELEAGIVDLVFGSPPYEDARTYGINFRLSGKAWVEWMVERWLEWDRVCKGLVAMVVEGRTKQFAYSATPMRLAVALQDAGLKLRKPPVFHRVGIPGSGGPDWLRNDYEFIICTSNGKLPWSDNTAMGHEPKYPPGGAPSHRMTATRGSRNGDTRVEKAVYRPPRKANPGNVIHCKVGGGLMGSPLAHANEAPFPEALAEFFVRSFCPPGGIVLDPFSGSGTTAAAAIKAGRRAIGIDVRESQAELSQRRVEAAMNETPLFSGLTE